MGRFLLKEYVYVGMHLAGSSQVEDVSAGSALKAKKSSDEQPPEPGFKKLSIGR